MTSESRAFDIDAALDRDELRAIREEMDAGVELDPTEIAQRLDLSLDELMLWASAWLIVSTKKEMLN